VHRPPSFEPQHAAPWKLDEEAGQDASFAEGRQAKSQRHPKKHGKLQDDVFKKNMTPERRHRPIRRS
jgi:hypothetical protein